MIMDNCLSSPTAAGSCSLGLAADEREQIEYFLQGRVYSMQIESTDACEQGCLFCYARSSPRTLHLLTSDEIRTILTEASEMGIRMIDWLGGDPLLREDWYELMEFAAALGLTNNLWTSGYPLRNKETARRAVAATDGGFISVHVDSLDDTLYQKLHRPENALEIKRGILQGVDNIIALGKPPGRIINCITFTALQAGEDVKKTISWFWEQKQIRTCLTLFNPAGLGKGHREWEPSLPEIRDAYGWRDRVNYRNAHSIGVMDVNKYYCGGIVCVTFKGDVTPCSVIRNGVGNIRRESISSILQKHKDKLLFRQLHDPENLPGYCAGCEHNSRCWGCRSSAFYYTGSETGVDPKCWMNPDNWDKKESINGDQSPSEPG